MVCGGREPGDWRGGGRSNMQWFHEDGGWKLGEDAQTPAINPGVFRVCERLLVPRIPGTKIGGPVFAVAPLLLRAKTPRQTKSLRPMSQGLRGRAGA